MATGHLVARCSHGLDPARTGLGASRRVLDVRRTPAGMDATTRAAAEPSMTLSALAAFLSVSNQALYGPRGFRVGRQIRFRMSEVEAWIARMEAADGERHHVRGGP